MKDITKTIQKLAFDLLETNQVKQVIGFTSSSILMSSKPILISSKDQAKRLVFNSHCSLNLANYLRNLKEKTAVIAKGCDTRNIITHIVENQIDKENLYIIGVPCIGMIDKVKITSLFDDDIIGFSENKNTLIVKSKSKEQKINKKDFMQENCTLCTHKNPVIYDVMAGEPVKENILENPYPDVDKIQSMDTNARWEYFVNLTKNCIRCYACKNACPLCYCPTCFVDESNPQWVGKGQNSTDVATFHFLRAFHCAGRCTDCGACVAACPMNINVRDFTRKLNKDCFDLFNWEAGLNVSSRPPLDVYKPNDPDDFIK